MTTPTYGVKMIQEIAWRDTDTEKREILLAWGMSQASAAVICAELHAGYCDGEGTIYGDEYSWENSFEIVEIPAKNPDDYVNCLLLEDGERKEP